MFLLCYRTQQVSDNDKYNIFLFKDFREVFTIGKRWRNQGLTGFSDEIKCTAVSGRNVNTRSAAQAKLSKKLQYTLFDGSSIVNKNQNVKAIVFFSLIGV